MGKKAVFLRSCVVVRWDQIIIHGYHRSRLVTSFFFCSLAGAAVRSQLVGQPYAVLLLLYQLSVRISKLSLGEKRVILIAGLSE
jgi:hypothetical protein